MEPASINDPKMQDPGMCMCALSCIHVRSMLRSIDWSVGLALDCVVLQSTCLDRPNPPFPPPTHPYRGRGRRGHDLRRAATDAAAAAATAGADVAAAAAAPAAAPAAAADAAAAAGADAAAAAAAAAAATAAARAAGAGGAVERWAALSGVVGVGARARRGGGRAYVHTFVDVCVMMKRMAGVSQTAYLSS